MHGTGLDVPEPLGHVRRAARSARRPRMVTCRRHRAWACLRSWSFLVRSDRCASTPVVAAACRQGQEMGHDRSLAFQMAQLGIAGGGRQPTIEENFPQVVEHGRAVPATRSSARPDDRVRARPRRGELGSSHAQPTAAHRRASASPSPTGRAPGGPAGWRRAPARRERPASRPASARSRRGRAPAWHPVRGGSPCRATAGRCCTSLARLAPGQGRARLKLHAAAVDHEVGQLAAPAQDGDGTAAATGSGARPAGGRTWRRAGGSSRSSARRTSVAVILRLTTGARRSVEQGVPDARPADRRAPAARRRSGRAPAAGSGPAEPTAFGMMLPGASLMLAGLSTPSSSASQMPVTAIEAFLRISSTTLLAVLMSGSAVITGERP